MLVLTRRRGQAICIGDNIRIVVTRIDDGQVRLGIESSENLTILREELLETVKQANQSAQTLAPNDFEHWLKQQHHTDDSGHPEDES
ncbi:carbon storage regulator [Acidithiobacillus montserratensis]|uniref:Carbon storage regulator n=1 Tax=Acidithiobacillus montserratensis TaxID=2729135 RepID=A0ACD5HIP2_9PROT|nr:carbon storage regulator [Acidithiobacillaceae bacterium]MBU2747077.1 carbon storage regulator [Acidithiobacillus montserratensis]